jgi:hypothetical protein
VTRLTANGAAHSLAPGTVLTHSPNNTGSFGTPATAITPAGSGTVTAVAGGIRFNDPAGASNVARWDWNSLLNGTKCSIEIELDPCDAPGAAEMRFVTVRNVGNTADVAFVQVLSGRTVRVYNNATTSLWTMATALPSAAGSRVHVGIDLAAGTLEVRIYTASDGKSNTAVETKAAFTVNWNGATSIGGMRFGAITSAADWDQVFRNVRIDDTITAPMGALAPTVTPVIDLGAARTGEAREVVTLTAATVAGSPSGYTWAQVSGSTASLAPSGATCAVTLPATYSGDSIVIGCTPTGGPQDTVSIGVAPQPMWARLPGSEVWVPAGPVQAL